LGDARRCEVARGRTTARGARPGGWPWVPPDGAPGAPKSRAFGKSWLAGWHAPLCQVPGAGKQAVSRKNEVAAIRIRFPYKLPVILERYSKEKILPALNKVKFLVPGDFTMGQFVAIIRNRMGLMSTQAFYFLVNGNHSLVNMSATMGDVYTTYKDEDGFLYMTYASQEMFG
uniref:Microtubule-associated proteins 1A/1B light chain 3C n=1 Tax=Laticauda laticaudata TaxID=8630 RepID=A0A8C5SD34_LATLA